MGLASCSKSPGTPIRELLPGFSDEMIRHLSQDDQASFQKFARDTGTDSVITVYSLVFLAPRTDSLALFERDEAALAPCLHKLETTLIEEFKIPSTRNYQGAYHRASLSDRREIVRLSRELRVLAFADGLSFQERADAYLQLIERCRPYSRAINLGLLYATYASYLPRLGRSEELPTYLNLAVSAALEAGDLETASQTLGTLGTFYNGQGDYDRMRDSWNQGLRLARQSQTWQEARILSFYSWYYLNHGRLALSRELIHRAQDRCRELEAFEVEIRFLMNEINTLCELECWPLIGKELDRAEELMRLAKEGEWSIHDRTYWQTQIRKLRAQYLSATGNCAAAEEMATDVMRDLPKLRLTPALAVTRVHVAQALRNCGRLNEGISALDEGEALCRQNNIPEVLEVLEVEKAEVYFTLGDLESCRVALEASRAAMRKNAADEISRESLRRDVLSVRLAMRHGKVELARALLKQSLLNLKQQRKELDFSPDAAMALPSAAELGDLAHELLDTSPEDGYAREMAWRLEEAGLSPRGNSTDVLRRLSKRNAAHCVYRVQKDRVLRWSAYQGRVVCDEIPLGFEDLDRRIRSLREALWREPDGMSSALASSRDLANQLLPPCVLKASGPAELFVTRDGPLNQLPFEVLNVVPTGYRPLLSQCDMAYVLFDRLTLESSRGPAIIVSEPTYPPDLARRYSILTEALPFGTKEAVSFGRSFPNTVSFSGLRATKSNLFNAWTQAQALYFACHVIRDPEVPYIMFLPLASDSAESDEANYLDITDIRSADLSHCRLVVLSSCGTGAPYSSGRISAPSLAEGFVQAGAEAVVHTAWEVRDEDAAKLMQKFETFYTESKNPISALNQARRQLLGEDAAPQLWAAYSITLGSL